MPVGAPLSGSGGRVKPGKTQRTGWAVMLALASLIGCRWPQVREAPVPLAKRLTWYGRAAERVNDSTPADTAFAGACTHFQSLEFPGTDAPFRLELRQYRSSVWAFAAWEALGKQTRPQEGCARIGKRWAFLHGAYLGLTDSSAGDLYPEEFRERLASSGEPVFILPQEFEAFPLQGRIPGTERVNIRHFLGGSWRGAVFSLGYSCHGDSAIAFRSGVQNGDSVRVWMRDWKGHNLFENSREDGSFTGQDEFGRPILLRKYSEGIFGISGCFDSELSQQYAEKMGKMREFWHDP
jgi:hypothetical protein